MFNRALRSVWERKKNHLLNTANIALRSGRERKKERKSSKNFFHFVGSGLV